MSVFIFRFWPVPFSMMLWLTPQGTVVLYKLLVPQLFKKSPSPTTFYGIRYLTLILLTWRIWWASNNAGRWQMRFNSAFKGIISVFTTARHLSQCWARLIQSTFFCRIYLRYILILSLFLRLDLPRGLFSFTLPRQTSLGIVLRPPICHLPPQSHPSGSDHANNIWWPVQFTEPFLYEFSTSTGWIIDIRP